MTNMLGSSMAATTLLLLCACTVQSSSRRPPTPQTYVPPNAAGVQARRAETYTPAAPHPAQFANAYIYLPGSAQRTPVTFQNVGGMAIYEGDIMLGPSHQVQAMYAFPRLRPKPAGSPQVSYATSTPNASHLWPGGVLPFEIAASVTPEKRSYVEWATAHVTSQSVLQMRPRLPTDKDYITFTESGGGYGCSSYVGRVGGGQEIRVAGCGKGSVVHEIGHAAGFYHEQSRTDRDQYVTIDYSAISPGHEKWFEIRKGAQDIGTYDYASIMHYSRKAFSKNGNDTIITKGGANIGQREGLSPLDKAALAQLYSGAPMTTPPGTNPPGTNPPATTGFAGSYSSDRGAVSCTESGSTVNCTIPGGTMVCTVQGSGLDCGWFGGGQGRAAFTRQANGDLTGSYGDFLSNNSRGAWNLTRTGGPTSPPPGNQPPGIPGLPTIPGLPPLPTAVPGLPGLPPFPAAPPAK
jgi:Astacin (Peptidase family M12A)